MALSKNDIASRMISRKYNLMLRRAWHVTQRIREAMMTSSGFPFSGTVVTAETYIDGNPRPFPVNTDRQVDAAPVRPRVLHDLCRN